MDNEILKSYRISEDALSGVIQKKGKCSFCGKTYENYGNDPWPLAPKYASNMRCCDACNMSKVIPARLKLMKGEKS